MSKLRQILKMYSQGKSKLFITQIVGVSRNKVKNYARIFVGLSKSFDEVHALSDKELDDLFKRQHTVRHEVEVKEL